MRVLIIKMSSMGDVIHTLPALTDAGRANPSIHFDWVVEENFAEIPKWHPLVDKVIPIALRRWRKKPFDRLTREQFLAFCRELRSTQYDLIIDAQGLLKSALVTVLAKGKTSGLDRHSAREFLAALFYKNRFAVDKKQHAISRTRELFSQALGYALPISTPDYGVDRKRFGFVSQEHPYVVFLHGTTWATKHWPEKYWLALAELANQNGYQVKLPWGNQTEHDRAQRIANQQLNREVLPKLDLLGMAKVLAQANAIVAVDTGLGHLAAALDVPTVSLYGPTNPVLTGALGQSQLHLSAAFPCAPCLSRECTHPNRAEVDPPCFSMISPQNVWNALENLVK